MMRIGKGQNAVMRHDDGMMGTVPPRRHRSALNPRRWVVCLLAWSLVALNALAMCAAESSKVLTAKVSNQPSRLWTDDSGRHQTMGQMVAIGPRHVLLLKDNARHSTVELTRLSVADRRYIEEFLASRPTRPPADAGAVSQADSARDSDPVRDSDQASLPAVSGDVVAYLYLSRGLLEGFRTPIQEVSPVALSIRGVPARGWSRTDALPEIQLVTDTTRAVLEIPVRGSVESRTVSSSHPVEVSVHGMTNFLKSFRLVISASGAELESISLDANSRYQTTGITTSMRLFRRLVLRIASRRVRAQKAANDQDASRQQYAMIDRQVSSAAQALSARLNQGLRSVLADLTEVDALRDHQFHFATDPNGLRLTMSAKQSTNITPPPAAPISSVPFVIHIHATAIDQAIRQDVLAQVKPIVEKLAADMPNAAAPLRQRLADGHFDTTWSDDQAWLTITGSFK